MTEKTSKKIIKRLSKGERTHNRRVKQAARKGPEIIKPKRSTVPPVSTISNNAK